MVLLVTQSLLLYSDNLLVRRFKDMRSAHLRYERHAGLVHDHRWPTHTRIKCLVPVRLARRPTPRRNRHRRLPRIKHHGLEDTQRHLQKATRIQTLIESSISTTSAVPLCDNRHNTKHTVVVALLRGAPARSLLRDIRMHMDHRRDPATHPLVSHQHLAPGPQSLHHCRRHYRLPVWVTAVCRA